MQHDQTTSRKQKKKIAPLFEKKRLQNSGNPPKINPDSVIERLVNQYLPYATSIATKVVRTLSSDIDFDEVLCNARLGLLEAARRFNDEFGVDFKTFAYYRIRGAIFDGLRKTGWLPRSLYAKIKYEQAASEYLQKRYGEDTGKYPESEIYELCDTVDSLASIYVMSIDSVDDLEIEDHDASKRIEHRAEFQKVKEKVCDAIESLPDKERKLIKMYYFQSKTLEDIGEQLELSKSWTSRLHTRSLELLFKKISLIGKEGF